MAVESISGGYASPRQLKAFVSMDDASARKIAWAKTQQDIDFKKHKRLDNSFNLLLPLAGGISAAAVAEKGARLASFTRNTAAWGMFMAGIAATFGLANFAKVKSENVANFADKHPILTFLTTATAAYFVGNAALKGGSFGYNKLKSTPVFSKVANYLDKNVAKLKDTNFVKNSAAYAKSFAKNIPSALKVAGKKVASWAPLITLAGALIHSCKFNNEVSRQYNRNYSGIKDLQANIMKEMIAQNEA